MALSATLLSSSAQAITQVDPAGLIPVSYTHLDVYKRQVVDCVLRDSVIGENATVIGAAQALILGDDSRMMTAE